MTKINAENSEFVLLFVSERNVSRVKSTEAGCLWMEIRLERRARACQLNINI